MTRLVQNPRRCISARLRLLISIYDQIQEHLDYHELLERDFAFNATVTESTGINISSFPPVQQRFELLPQAPTLPIIDIARTFVQRLASVPVKTYISRILGTFSNLTSAEEPSNVTMQRRGRARSTSATLSDTLFHRQDDTGPDTGDCTADSPCSDGSCCNSEGHCGYGAANCGAGNCTANCKSLNPSKERQAPKLMAV